MNKIQHCEKRISIVFCQTLFHLMCTPCGCTLCMVVGDYTIKMKTNFDFNFLYQGVKQHRYKKNIVRRRSCQLKKLFSLITCKLVFGKNYKTIKI